MITATLKDVSEESTRTTTLIVVPGGLSLIETKTLKFLTITETANLYVLEALKKAIPLILAKRALDDDRQKEEDKKVQGKENKKPLQIKKTVGGLVEHKTNGTVSIARLVKMEYVAITENHPQYIPIRGIEGWCLLKSETAC